MRDPIREKLSKLGLHQRRILIRLGEQHGVTSREDLSRRWPARRVDLAPNILGPLAQTLRQLQSLSGSIPTAETEHAPYLREEYFLEAEAEIAEAEGWVSLKLDRLYAHEPRR